MSARFVEHGNSHARVALFASSQSNKLTHLHLPCLTPLAIALSCLCWTPPSFGSEQDRSASPVQEATTLGAITVTATRSPNQRFELPASVSTVDRQQLEQIQSTTVSTLLRTLPNVNYGGGPRAAAQSPAIRGLQGPRIILSVDGARRNNDGGVNTPLLIDPDFIRQVDVVRGPVSAAYGSGGLGGVMAFETIGVNDILDAEQTMGGRVKAGYHSADKQFFTNLTAAVRSGPVDILASGTYRNYGDIHTGADGDHARYPNDGRLDSQLFKGGFEPNSLNRIEVSYQRFADKLIGPTNPGGNLLFPFSQELRRKQEQYTASWAFHDEQRRALDGKVSLYQTEFKLEGDSRSSPPQPHTSTLTRTRGASLQNSSRFETGQWAAHRLTYGVDFYRDTNRNTSAGQTNTVLPNGHMRSLGVFLQDEVSLFDNWTVIAALRHDNYKLSSPGQNTSSHQRLSPKITLKYQPWEVLGVYGSYGQAFRAPTVTEMFGNLDTPRALFNFRPNPELEPETSKTTEVGAMLSFDNVFGQQDQLRIKASYFSEDVKDMIDQQIVGRYTRQAPFSGTGLVFQRLNVAKGERHGTELEMSYTWDALTLGLGYSRLRAKNAHTGVNLYAPPDKLALAAHYKLTPNWSLMYLGQFVRAQDYDSTELRQRSGYATHDIGVSYEQSRYRIDVGITNLFDKGYATYQQSLADTFSYEQGRSFNVTLSARF
ncbi:TonB-dependent receptor [Alcaligenes faecalis]|uniref:TonB-dependent hemoglobin/transferrin/lactoferrin family receptor n=1 Tax=Alcaligenes faecalis TaxID=511 RepID=UPI0019318FAB|nr:TonB-dependent hemoglobin/transferrin/lactoferrin family receptor [Alcaligenes faecalis]QRF90593.1 TonB-dependent receptor [Alcaligenes faecalis]